MKQKRNEQEKECEPKRQTSSAGTPWHERGIRTKSPNKREPGTKRRHTQGDVTPPWRQAIVVPEFVRRDSGREIGNANSRHVRMQK